jgi:hypothetical protein
MEVGGQVALLAGVGVMRESLDGGGRGRPSAALDVAGEALSTEVGIMTFYQITRTGARLWMADDAVGRFHVTHLGWAVVAFSAVGVSQARMEIGGQVALLTGVGVVRVSLDGGGRGCNDSCTFSVTDETLGTHTGIMIIGQITRTRVSQGMTCNTVSWLNRPSMPMTLDAVSVPRIIM